METIEAVWTHDDEGFDHDPSEAIRVFEWLSPPPRPAPRVQAPVERTPEAVLFRRQNATWLEPAQQNNLLDAINGLRVTNNDGPGGRPPPDRRWGRLIDMHRTLVPQIHGIAPFWDSGRWWRDNVGTVPCPVPTDAAQLSAVHQFLPWHRLFIRMYEMELQRQVAGVCLPYWDWRTVRRLPGWVLDSRAAHAVTTDAQGSLPINRSVTGSTVSPRSGSARDFDTLPGDDDISAATRLSGYLNFTCEMEMQHNRPHGWVGDTLGVLATAPADFIFFMHHAQIDRLWCQWQRSSVGVANPRASTALALPSGWSPPVIGGRTIRTIGDVEDVTNLEYDYV